MYVLLSAKFSEYESSLLPNYMYSILVNCMSVDVLVMTDPHSPEISIFFRVTV